MYLIKKSAPYGSKGVLRYNHYSSDTKWGPGIISLRIIPSGCHDYIAQLSITWDPEIRYACNQFIYGIVYDIKYSLIIGSHNNWIIMNF